MSLNRIPEPWGALTSEIDAGAKCEAELHCPGGFAPRSTAWRVRLPIHLRKPSRDKPRT